MAIIAPHKEAVALIDLKHPIAMSVFKGMLPELRGRAFAITGVESANVLQRVSDAIAALPQGGPDGTWDKVKDQVASELEPYLGEEGAQTRAGLLVRTHGFQVFNASQWRVAQEDADTTHLQYLATEDDRARPTHLALNGLVLPKNDPFWQKHYPPWEWGCRCRCRPMNPDMVDAERAMDEEREPEDRNVIEGPALTQLRNGTLIRAGRRYDVTAPSDRQNDGSAFEWHPDDLRLPLGELKLRYDPQVWNAFEQWAKDNFVSGQTTVWNWLMSKPKVKI